MKTICHVTTVHSAYDDRIYYKECTSLSNLYNVYLVSPKPECEIKNNKIHLITIRKYNNRFFRILCGGFISFVKVLKLKPHVVHFHDPEFIPFAIVLKLFNFKIIYDIHELYYAQIRLKKWLYPAFNIILQYLYNLFERIIVRYADAVILASSGMIEYYKNRYASCYNRKFEVINNFPDISLFKRVNENNSFSDKFTLIYTGGLSKNRGIVEIIKALEDLDDVRLLLIGTWESEEFHNYCKSLKGYKNVNYEGFVEFDKVPLYLAKANVGVCILHDTENHKISIPVKILEYFSYGLPVIASNFDFWKKVFQNSCIYVNYNNIEEIKNAIVTLKINKKVYKEKSENALHLVKNELNWENEQKKLINLYKKVTGEL
ncbi:MAG: glycosyltransferase family 4 protein [Bacteroidales bacterium]|nr:glycosyltransferase family 4 protein [Bacteroidales bacterium]